MSESRFDTHPGSIDKPLASHSGPDRTRENLHPSPHSASSYQPAIENCENNVNAVLENVTPEIKITTQQAAIVCVQLLGGRRNRLGLHTGLIFPLLSTTRDKYISLWWPFLFKLFDIKLMDVSLRLGWFLVPAPPLAVRSL